MFELINQKYEILTFINREEILKKIEMAARTCYKSSSDKTMESASKFVSNIIKRGHESVIEHCGLTVRFVTDRAMLAELSRHRLCSFSVESQRYVSYNKKGLCFIKPLWINLKEGFYKRKFYGISTLFGHSIDEFDFEETPELEPNEFEFLRILNNISEQYQIYIENGLKPEQARDILPNCAATTIVMTANLREWRHIFKLRVHKAAHPQMQALMAPLLDELKEQLPEIFNDIDNN